MWVAVAKLADLAAQRACVVRAGGIDLALVCTAEGLFAMDNLCPHSGGPLGEGLVQGNTITCPLHGWQFECATGRSLTEKRPAQRLYPVKVEAGQVLVEVPDPVATAAEPASQAPQQAPAAVDPAAGGERSGIAARFASGSPERESPDHSRAASGGSRGGGAAPPGSTRLSPVEAWKQAKHGIDVWPDVLRHARERTPMSKIEEADLERMKWYGFFYRKNNDNDRYMCRIRIPGCEMSAEQARAVAYIAYQSGYGIVDVTTRGNLQIQGLTIDKLPLVQAGLERAGLTSRQSGHDNVRNVTSHPWSGIDPEERIDTRELARQIQAMLIGNRELSDLPRKVNVALTGRSDPSAHAWTQDICYVACQGPDASVGFQLLLGGNQGQSPKLSWHIPVFVRPEQVLGVTAAVLRTFRELGYRHNRHQVRMRYLIERIGPDGMLLEVEQRLGYELERCPRPVSRPTQEQSFIGWFQQKQPDHWALGVCVPVGRLTAEELEGLAVVARQYGDGTLRTTYDQNLVLPGMRSSRREEAAYAVARHGLSFEPDLATRNMVACTGKQFCNIAVTETKGYAYQLIEELRRRRVQLHGVKIHMSGCPSSCAMSYTADVGLKGVKIRRGLRVLDAFDLYLGGGLGEDVQMGTLYQKGVPFGELPDVVAELAHDFHLHRSTGETFSGYWRRKLSGHKPEPLKVERPRWSCTRCGHLHVAEDPPPFCPVCAAIRSKFEPAADDTGDPAAASASPAAGAGSAPEPPAGSGAAPWVCRSCGLKHGADQPPDLCSVCGAPKTEFHRPPAAGAGTPRAAGRRAPGGKRILIVGGSVGGHTAAQTARALDPDARITLVTDEQHSFYNRLNLTRHLAREVERTDLFDYAPEWYAEQQVEVLTATRVIGLDPIQKLALLAEGRELAYDACVLTHGSAAHTPPFYRELGGVFLLRTLADVERILARTREGARAAVIGGGVLGLEAAYGLKTRGASVRVFEYLPRLMPRQLDQAGAELFLGMVQAKGIEALTGVSVASLLGASETEGLALADGRQFEADLLVVSTGIRPNTDWVKRSGIQCNRGVVVDERMQTSAPDVYAAGDVAEWRGQVVGLWTNAIEQAKVAATNAVGRMALFQGFLPVTVLKCLGIDLISIGEVLDDGDGITSKTVADDGTYRRVVFRHGIPVGGILLGTSSGMGELRRLIEGGLELEKLRRKVVPDEVMAGA